MSLIGLPVTVLGGGIAGLAAARALALRGAEVTVLEQSEALGEVGAGLQISPNGARVLDALGLGQDLRGLGLRAEAVEFRDQGGARVARLDVGGTAPGYFFLHRADLVGLLAEGVREAGVQVRLLQRIEAVKFGEQGAVLRTAQGGEHRAGLVIGADGLHSVVRQAMNGRVVPFFTRQVAWRALVPAEGGMPPVATVWMGPKRHLVTYPLRGGQLVNVVAVEERGTWAEEGWHHKDDPVRLRAAFAGFAPEVRRLLERVEEVYLWGLFRHPVAKAWHAGGAAAILGDAAHPTLPFLAQGANLALEDAWVLAARLSAHATVEAGLAAYQAARAPRAARVIAAATRNARNYHLSAPPVRAAAHLALRLSGALAPGALLGRFDWLYGY
ncbi:MAG: FAD-dependent monooxygenase, partial [Paracoccaceae bacterium]|nr:FAD-dependent monooxygenase [Paracoccaceae bacterium]